MPHLFSIAWDWYTQLSPVLQMGLFLAAIIIVAGLSFVAMYFATWYIGVPILISAMLFATEVAAIAAVLYFPGHIGRSYGSVVALVAVGVWAVNRLSHRKVPVMTGNGSRRMESRMNYISDRLRLRTTRRHSVMDAMTTRPPGDIDLSNDSTASRKITSAMFSDQCTIDNMRLMTDALDVEPNATEMLKLYTRYLAGISDASPELLRKAFEALHTGNSTSRAQLVHEIGLQSLMLARWLKGTKEAQQALEGIIAYRLGQLDAESTTTQP